jgi:hypothetical protein
MWSLGICGFTSVCLLAFSLTAPTPAGGLAAMSAGVLGIFLTPLAAFSRRARLGLWYLGWALALATWLTAFEVIAVVVHALAMVVFVVVGTGSGKPGQPAAGAGSPEPSRG